MSAGPDLNARADWTPDALAARAARAGLRAEADLRAAIDDLFLPDAARLDDRLRGTLTATLRALVATLEAGLRRHAARLLAARGDEARAEALLTTDSLVWARLTRAGVLRDPELMGELVARARQDLIADALPLAIGTPDAPSLIVRLAAAPDAVVARAANAVLAADGRRRSAQELGAPEAGDLPAELQHRLIWWVAAAIRDGDDAAIDPVLVEAAERQLAAHDEGDRPEAAAYRLAAAIDARPDERAALLVEALGDRRLGLFVALIAHGVPLPHEQARAIVLEPAGDRLWLALRALALGREAIARIALALADADPARDIEAVADQLDAIAAIAPDQARASLAPLALHRDYRAAIRAIGGTR